MLRSLGRRLERKSLLTIGGALEELEKGLDMVQRGRHPGGRGGSGGMDNA